MTDEEGPKYIHPSSGKENKTTFARNESRLQNASKPIAPGSNIRHNPRLDALQLRRQLLPNPLLRPHTLFAPHKRRNPTRTDTQ